MLEAARAIRDVIADKPLLFTFRSAKEGGEQALSVENYIALNRAAIDSGLVDMIDPSFSPVMSWLKRPSNMPTRKCQRDYVES